MDDRDEWDRCKLGLAGPISRLVEFQVMRRNPTRQMLLQ
jgi:hypothetical protein